MTDRLTPEQIASTYKGGVKVLRRLEQSGYVVVVADDLRTLIDDWYRIKPDGVNLENSPVDFKVTA